MAMRTTKAKRAIKLFFPAIADNEDGQTTEIFYFTYFIDNIDDGIK